MAYANLQVTREEPVLTIAIDHPPANALDQATLADLLGALAEAEADGAIRAVVVTGMGTRFFVSGADINEFVRAGSARALATLAHRGNEVFNRIERFPKPVVAAVNGYALGGGCELAMACDLRVAAEKAQFGQPEINLGIIPGWGGLQRLPRLIGRTKALELLLTGDRITSADALRLGLVNQVVPDDQLLPQAVELARRLALQAPLAVAAIKARVVSGADESIDGAVAGDEQAFAAIFDTADAKEGIAAFFEKRKAQFSGR